MKSRIEILKLIDNAFPYINRPSNEELFGSGDILKNLDVQSALSIFGNKSAEEIDALQNLDELVTSAENIYWMASKGQLYFLPCYLRYLINKRHIWEFQIAYGIVKFLDINNEFFVAFSRLNDIQIQCIYEFLKFIFEHRIDYDLTNDLLDNLRLYVFKKDLSNDELRRKGFKGGEEILLQTLLQYEKLIKN